VGMLDFLLESTNFGEKKPPARGKAATERC
jgi:hypothetical protein